MKKIFSIFAAVLLAGSMFATDTYVPFSGDLVEGDYLITYDGGAMKAAVSSSRFEYTTDLTISEGNVVDPSADLVWHIAPSGDYWTIYNASTSKYAAGTGAKNKAQLLDDGTDDKALWTASGTGTYEFENKANAAAGVNKNLRRNETFGFACYSTSTGGALTLYKLSSGSTPVVPPTLADGYYLVGSSMGWDATSGYQFDANPSVDGEYILNTTLAVNDELKVISYVGEQIVTWYPAGTNNNYVVDAAHAGAKTIYFRPAGNQAWATFHEGGYFFIEANLDPDNITTCYDARRAALSVSGSNVEYNNGHTYTIRGYVTSIATAYSSQYNNVSFWMADDVNGGQVIEAFRCAAQSAADAPKVGDLVEVTGKLTKYNNTPEFAAGCTCSIITAAADPVNLGAKTIAEFLSLKNAKDTCILTGAVKNIVMDSQDPTKPNKYGNFDLQDQTGTVYIYGLLTADGQAQKFQEMDIEEDDVITIEALYAEYNNNPQVKNAILVSVQKQATAVENIEQVNVTKIIRNGQVLILRDGIEYNMLGSELK